MISSQSSIGIEDISRGQRKSQRRRRAVISCTECHRRKQKCDRGNPCCNCTKREKPDLCRYDHESKGPQFAHTHSKQHEISDISRSTSAVLPTPESNLSTEDNKEDSQEIYNFGYSSQTSHNTLGLLRTTVEEASRSPSSGSFGRNFHPSQMTALSDTDVEYHALIHQLPLKPYIDILIHTFFDVVNWQYDLLVENDFKELLESWRASIPDFSGGLESMSPDFKMLPALLFQVLAHALLFHPAEDDRLEGLLVITGKTLHDLAIEYSEIGANILSLLGKRCITLATVQAGLLRAAFLKSSGEVIEAWHDLGATIRNAQEIGLHTGRFAPNQTPTQVKVGERHAQETYIGHKIWIVLHIWDIHMGVVLGRPITTQLMIDDFALSVKDEQKRRELFSHWQTESDPPRPFDIILAGYNVAYRYFSDIHRLEQNGNRLEAYETIEKIHFELKENLDLLPSWCKLQNPDTRFDGIPGCQWLPMARESLTSLIHLVFLALHRPYIFSMPASRTEAAKAGLIILESQERVFQQMDLYQCKVFNPVYASFDAIVLIAAICMSVLGHEFEQLDECVQAVEKGAQRLGVIGQFNPMARSAHRVAWNLCRRLQTRLRKTDSKNILETPNTLNTGSSNSSDKLLVEGSLGLGFDEISPPHPMHDLLYDDLSVPQLPLTDPLTDLSFDPLNVDLMNSWGFEGNFSEASFWNLINEIDN